MTEDATLTARSAFVADEIPYAICAPPKSPPAPDETVTGRAIYDLAFAVLSMGGGAHEWGQPIKLMRKADDGSTVTTTYVLA